MIKGYASSLRTIIGSFDMNSHEFPVDAMNYLLSKSNLSGLDTFYNLQSVKNTLGTISNHISQEILYSNV